MNPEQDFEKPVAYDTEGRPLYYRPQPQATTNVLQQVEVVKDPNPEPVALSEEVMRKHSLSRKKYPNLNLSEEEYVISSVKRHPLGLISIWLSVAIVAVVILLVPITFQPGAFGLNSQALLFGSAILIALLIFAFLIGSVATMVYQANKFYLTNESVIQHIQTSLFSQNDQIVSLGNIEDASYTQKGMLQMLFGYGSIRLSTQGDETSYRLSWVSSPKQQIDLLNNAIEAFKNGRPVEG